jgi:hypothetical protein
MFKSFAAFLIFALLGASVIALPGFAPTVEASEGAPLAKADRLTARPTAASCSEAWPNFGTSCLQSRDTSRKIVEARLVTARR